MASPYKRRRPALIRNFWVYRNLIAVAAVLGVVLSFVWTNYTNVVVVFPFGLGKIESKTGIVILLSAAAGSLATLLAMAVIVALRRIKWAPGRDEDDTPALPDDRPPTDYASKTTEGFPD